jgi:hypothetical protein
MSIFKLIRDKIKKSKSKVHAITPNSVPETVLTEYLDGMGTATARILINRRLSEKFIKKYGLKDLENRGRYYSAKIIEPNGNLIDEVLIDKQNGIINSLHRKINSSD